MRHPTSSLRRLFALLGCLLMPLAWSADRARILVSEPERSASVQIVRDIAKFIARPAAIEFDLSLTASPGDTLKRLDESTAQQFAVLPADAAEAYLSAGARGSIEASRWFAPLRVIAPLHEEQIYFIVRSDSPLNFVHEIENSRINLGPLQANTPLSAATVYRLMFSSALPERQASFDAYPEALAKLTEKTVDVVVLVAAPSARLLTEMKPEARRFVKLLKFDPNHPVAAPALKVYSTSTVPAASYPSLLDEDLAVLAVPMYLVSHGRNDALQARLASTWCHSLPSLRAAGHPTLGGLEPGLPPLLPGWHYAQPFADELRACLDGKRATAESCSQESRALGLCG